MKCKVCPYALPCMSGLLLNDKEHSVCFCRMCGRMEVIPGGAGFPRYTYVGSTAHENFIPEVVMFFCEKRTKETILNAESSYFKNQNDRDRLFAQGIPVNHPDPVQGDLRVTSCLRCSNPAQLGVSHRVDLDAIREGEEEEAAVKPHVWRMKGT
jgi:hypothetical protein